MNLWLTYFSLQLMLKHGHRELILHPLTQELMRVKRYFDRHEVKYQVTRFFALDSCRLA